MTPVDAALLRHAAELGIRHLESLEARPAGARLSVTEVAAALGGPLPEEGVAPERVIDELVRGTEHGLVASPGPRYFGFATVGRCPPRSRPTG